MPGKKASEAERREQILTAAHHVALRQGIDGLTVRAVAARARLSHGLVLFHFKRKDQLVAAVHPVEVADRHHRPAGLGRQTPVAAMDAHGRAISHAPRRL